VPPGIVAGVAAAILLAGLSGATSGIARAQDTAAARGEYLFRAAGGCACHSVPAGDGFLAGGRALATPFGVFYSPNITPEPETGIGGWSDADFARAMTEGVAPDGSHYFPAFPYTSFTNMVAADLADLKAYLDTVPPLRRANTPHDLTAPFGWRFMVAAWKWLYFEPGPFTPDPDRAASWNRGAYLATAMAHCGECHTPRDALGGPDRALWYAGTADGPVGRRVPNITPHVATGIGDWSAADIAGLLKTAYKPDFDNVQGAMEEAIEQGYKFLTDNDRAAIAEYVASLPAIDHTVPTRRPAPMGAEN
jgi:mono/diheme cytochrome c family protein